MKKGKWIRQSITKKHSPRNPDVVYHKRRLICLGPTLTVLILFVAPSLNLKPCSLDLIFSFRFNFRHGCLWVVQPRLVSRTLRCHGVPLLQRQRHEDHELPGRCKRRRNSGSKRREPKNERHQNDIFACVRTSHFTSKDCICSVNTFFDGQDCRVCGKGLLCTGGHDPPMQTEGDSV